MIDQFVDRTYLRQSSFFGTGCVAHVSMAHPIAPLLRRRLIAAAEAEGIPCRDGGTYVCMEGPQFSSFAESIGYQAQGADVIGMTGATEAKLAREAEISYATVAMVTDYDCWHEEHGAVDVAAVVKVMHDNADKAAALVARVARRLSRRARALSRRVRPRARIRHHHSVRSTAIRSSSRSSTRSPGGAARLAAAVRVHPEARSRCGRGGSMIKNAFERVLFASRFLLTPLYLALAISLLALVGKAGLHLYQLITQLPTLDDEEVLLAELAIVDLTLTASLVVIVFLSGYTNFVAPVVMRTDDGRPHWIAEIDFGELKLKLMASIVAISAIKLLEGFMNVGPYKRPRTLVARRHPSDLRRLGGPAGGRRPPRPSVAPDRGRRRRRGVERPSQETAASCCVRMAPTTPTGRHHHPEQGEKTSRGAIPAARVTKRALFPVPCKEDLRRGGSRDNRENNRTITGPYQGHNRRENRRLSATGVMRQSAWLWSITAAILLHIGTLIVA